MKKAISFMLIVLGVVSIILGGITMNNDGGYIQGSSYLVEITSYEYYGGDAYSGMQQAAADAANNAAQAAYNIIDVERAIHSLTDSIAFGIGSLLLVFGAFLIIYGLKSIPTKASVNLSNGNTSNENRIASEPININKTKNNTKKHKKVNDISKDSFDKEECDEEECDEEEYIDINCPDCNKKLSFRKDESAMICPNCYKIIYSATHNLEKDISALNANWKKDISALDTETVYQRYSDESEWSEEYRYLCYKELEKRSANRSK